jgi:hypothetical protein
MEISRESIDALHDILFGETDMEFVKEIEYIITVMEQRLKLVEEISKETNEVPLGVELRNFDEQYAIIVEDADEVGKARAVYFDCDGFFGHSTHNYAIDVLKELVSEGFYLRSDGALEEFSQSPVWMVGNEKLGLIASYNAHRIALEGMAHEAMQINQRYDL